MLTVYDLKNINPVLLEQFFLRCKELGFVNNVSLEAIRIHYVLQREGNIWFTVRDNEIIGMAGCHRFDEIDPTSFRVLFRGCELPGREPMQGLSKSYFKSSGFRELLPYQLAWITDKGYDKNNVYVTANTDNVHHKIMTIQERLGLFTRYQDRELFGVDQTIWKLNTATYEAARQQVTSYVV
jgi:hypothetical protein